MGKSVSSLLQIVVKKCKSYLKRKWDQSRVNSAVEPPPADSLLHLNQSNIDASLLHLPDEVIELILSRSPVKSVVRFKSVSKSWLSIISDPRFSGIHRIHRSKVSENQNKFLLLAHGKVLSERVYLKRWDQDGVITTESMLPYPSPIFNIPLCTCNGLILLGQNGKNHHFLLWNPSIRKYIMISGPRNGPHPPRLSHFYCDPMNDDYKIVFVYEKCYTVYSCKKGNWSEMKGLPCDLSLIYRYGASVDGCFYGLDCNGEIVCFDTRDENLQRFRHPNDVEVAVALREVSGRLYFFGYLKDGKGVEMWAMEKDGSFEKWVMEKNGSFKEWCCPWSWKKLINMEKEEVAEICLTNNACLGIMTTKVTENKYDFCTKSRIYLYSENLYMPCSNILAP